MFRQTPFNLAMHQSNHKLARCRVPLSSKADNHAHDWPIWVFKIDAGKP
jgi:hypothetical protein